MGADMKNILLVLILLPWLSACSDDFSDCEKIGHVRGMYTVADCQDTDVECEPEYKEDCDNIPDKSTEQGCRDFIVFLNKLEEDATYILRCPLTGARAANKTSQEQYVLTNPRYVYNDGSDIVLSELLNDTDNIYLFATGQEEGEYNYIQNYDEDGYHFMRYNK